MANRHGGFEMTEDHPTKDPACNPQIKEAIRKQGFFVCNFESDGYLPAFSYSIGLSETWAHPEILTMGLSPEMNAGNIVECAAKIKGGNTIATNIDNHDFLSGFPVQFINVLPEHFPFYFGFGLNYYGDQNFEAMQLVWPDKQSNWPWDDDFNKDACLLQKLLDRDPGFAFYEPKNLGVIVSKGAFGDNKPILDVFHEEDGDWQFLTAEPRVAENAMLVCLEEVAKTDPSINVLFDLGYGKSAHRESPDESWSRE